MRQYCCGQRTLSAWTEIRHRRDSAPLALITKYCCTHLPFTPFVLRPPTTIKAILYLYVQGSRDVQYRYYLCIKHTFVEAADLLAGRLSGRSPAGDFGIGYVGAKRAVAWRHLHVA